MRSGYPIHARIHVLKEEQSLGPFTIDELLEGLEKGRFDLFDICLREDAIETERIRDVIDWEEPPPAPPAASPWSKVVRENGEPADVETESGMSGEKPSALPAAGTLLYAGHPSILTHPWVLLGLTGGVVGAFWLFPIDLGYSLVSLSAVALSLAGLFFIRFTRDYLITTRRVEVISGLIARSSHEVRIADIRAINVTCCGIPGIFGIGTVDFFTTGDDPEVRFERIWAADEIKKLVRRIQDESS